MVAHIKKTITHGMINLEYCSSQEHDALPLFFSTITAGKISCTLIFIKSIPLLKFTNQPSSAPQRCSPKTGKVVLLRRTKSPDETQSYQYFSRSFTILFGSTLGAKRATAFPSLSTINLEKFHLIAFTNRPVCFVLSHFQSG